MAEHPIPFTGPMVRAILCGKKTQTRRVIKPQPRQRDYPIAHIGPVLDDEEQIYRTWLDLTADGKSACQYDYNAQYWRCPYGQPGDVLWVRENYYIPDWHDLKEPTCIDTGVGSCVRYMVDGMPVDVCPQLGTWRAMPSIHMPRWASRITLRLTDVRVQRVQEISTTDCLAEGIPVNYYDCPHGLPRCATYQECYGKLWDSINAKRGYGWAVNPWVWALTFEVYPGGV